MKQYVVNEDGVHTLKVVEWSTDNVLATIDSAGLVTIDSSITSGTVVNITAIVDNTTLTATLTIN